MEKVAFITVAPLRLQVRPWVPCLDLGVSRKQRANQEALGSAIVMMD